MEFHIVCGTSKGSGKTILSYILANRLRYLGKRFVAISFGEGGCVFERAFGAKNYSNVKILAKATGKTSVVADLDSRSSAKLPEELNVGRLCEHLASHGLRTFFHIPVRDWCDDDFEKAESYLNALRERGVGNDSIRLCLNLFYHSDGGFGKLKEFGADYYFVKPSCYSHKTDLLKAALRYGTTYDRLLGGREIDLISKKYMLECFKTNFRYISNSIGGER